MDVFKVAAAGAASVFSLGYGIYALRWADSPKRVLPRRLWLSMAAFQFALGGFNAVAAVYLSLP